MANMNYIRLKPDGLPLMVAQCSVLYQKALWSKLNPADDENRIEMALRSLLIIDDKRKILVDTGIGTKFSEKYQKIYKIDQSKDNLISSLEKYDLEPKDITDVILTHLHLDHVGGATYKEDDKYKLTFPNASYYVQKKHHEWALEPSKRDKGSFIREDFKAIEDEGKLRLVDGYAMILPNIDVIIYDGHTVAQQLIKISDGINTLVCLQRFNTFYISHCYTIYSKL